MIRFEGRWRSYAIPGGRIASIHSDYGVDQNRATGPIVFGDWRPMMRRMLAEMISLRVMDLPTKRTGLRKGHCLALQHDRVRLDPVRERAY
jgi:hypothetical protein